MPLDQESHLLILLLCVLCSVFSVLMLRWLGYLRQLSPLSSPSLAKLRTPPKAQTVATKRLKGTVSKAREPAAIAPKTELQPDPKQPYQAFLVLDVEGTCESGTSYDYPNEIIEWPVVLLRWKKATKDRGKGSRVSELEMVDEFRTFVKPSWRPKLSEFCTRLTGISQLQVDQAPTFPEVMKDFARFLARNGLIDPETGERNKDDRFCWCTDTHYDIQDFVLKQCFISKVSLPNWISEHILDVRKMTADHVKAERANFSMRSPLFSRPTPRPFKISSQLEALGLPPFLGRQHSGIDDARNIARILTELAKRNVTLCPNTTIDPKKRWSWMGKPGKVNYEAVYTGGPIR